MNAEPFPGGLCVPVYSCFCDYSGGGSVRSFPGILVPASSFSLLHRCKLVFRVKT